MNRAADALMAIGFILACGCGFYWCLDAIEGMLR